MDRSPTSSHYAQPHQAAAMYLLDGHPRSLLLGTMRTLVCLLVVLLLLAPFAIKLGIVPQVVKVIFIATIACGVIGCMPMAAGLLTFHMPALQLPQLRAPLLVCELVAATPTQTNWPIYGPERPPRSARRA